MISANKNMHCYKSTVCIVKHSKASSYNRYIVSVLIKEINETGATCNGV